VRGIISYRYRYEYVPVSPSPRHATNYLVVADEQTKIVRSRKRNRIDHRREFGFPLVKFCSSGLIPLVFSIDFLNNNKIVELER
jgi:hypothetical protein